MGKNLDAEEYWKDRLRSLQEYRKSKGRNKPRKKVSQRKKGSAITVRDFFDPSLYRELKGIELKVTASPESWNRIERYVLENPAWFGLAFHSQFANPAILAIHEKNSPRGRQKKVHSFVERVKIDSGILYPLVCYWRKQVSSEWPIWVKDGLEKAKVEGIDLIGLGGNLDPKMLTAYIVGKIWGGTAKEIGLKPFFEIEERDSIENFYLTYIQPSRIRKRIAGLIKGKTPQEVTRLEEDGFPNLDRLLKTLR